MSPSKRRPETVSSIQPVPDIPIGRGSKADRLRAQVARDDPLARFSRSANLSVPDVDRLLPRLAEGVSDLVGDACAISLVSDDGEWIDLAAMHGRHPDDMAVAGELTGSRTGVDEGISGWVVATGQTFFRPTIGGDEPRADVRAGHEPVLDQGKVHGIITAPLLVRGGAIGTVTALRLSPGPAYTEADRTLLEQLADRAAVAIDNARLYASRVEAEASLRASEQRLREAVRTAEDRALQQETVAELGRMALTRVDLDEMLAAAVQAVTKCLDTEYASLLELQPGGDGLFVRAGTGWDEGLVGKMRVPVGRGSHAGYTLLVGEPVIMEDVALEARFSPPQPLVEHEVTGGASVIVSLEGEPFGVLGTYSRRPRRFSIDEVNFLESVANVIAMAVVRTRGDELQDHARHQDRLAAIGQFAAGVAHDFNNLITTIRLHTEFLESRPGLDAHSLQELAHIRREAEQAAAMVWQILDFAHRDPIARVEIDLDSLCEEEMPVLRRVCSAGVRVRLRRDGGSHVVVGNTSRLQQILMNLTTNASDAMAGSGRLDIRLSRLEIEAHSRRPLAGMAPGSWVRLDVSDTGTGIPSEVLHRVFEPFFSTKGPPPG